MIRRGYSLIVTEMFDEVLFRDHIGGLNHWVLVGAVLLVEMFQSKLHSESHPWRRAPAHDR
jgi:hypothetical protein